MMFTFYADVLLLNLKKVNLGCQFGDPFMGALGYDDDVVIIPPIICSLKSMFCICDALVKNFMSNLIQTNTSFNIILVPLILLLTIYYINYMII